ncbi:MAG: ATP-dependent helicase [Dehalococcoidales bacterium]|jgi:superfamily I DNA/RNA helicase|nr:ATP-dependent helicase [Dehalococcoidales bacterium]
MDLSTQQQAVVEAVARNDCDVRVTARAGCGKTTTILHACGPAKGRVGFIAFNKAIVKDLATKAPPHVRVQTLHSLGAACLSSALGYRPDLDPDKVYLLAKAHLNEKEKDLISPIIKLVGLIKNNLADPSDEVMIELCYVFGIDIPDDSERLYDVVREVLTDCIPVPGRTCTIDFDDMIWLPVVMNLDRYPQYDWLFVDESQDLNACQMELVQRCARHGHVCFVGDPAQAIYAFRGADSTAMDTMEAHLTSTGRKVLELPLNKTYRCPKKIVALAKRIVPDFEALPQAPEGLVKEISGRDFKASPGDMVLCRTNAPLVSIAYVFIRAGTPVKIQGRDIGSGLIALINKLKPLSIDDLLDKVSSYRERELKKIEVQYRDKPSRRMTAEGVINDKVDTIKELACEHSTVEELITSIHSIFSDIRDTAGVVLLSTIHKAKGLEARRVVWLILPKGFQGEQERNLEYVAMTRAKEELVMCYME